MTTYTVGEVAGLTHVSVRTLHHYDAVGLLVPGGRTGAGYRTYSAEDLARLRQILFYRELGFGLEEIKEMLADPGATADDHLRRQHRLLREQIDHGRELLAAVEKEMEARQMGIALTPEEQFEIFGENGMGEQYAEEAQQRWGDTEAWAQSQARTAAMTKDDWIAVKAGTDANEAAFAAAMRGGEPADGPVARELAEAHRAGISRFWDCSHEAHRCLGEMYVADQRFTKHYDDIAPGLARPARRPLASGDLCGEWRVVSRHSREKSPLA